MLVSFVSVMCLPSGRFSDEQYVSNSSELLSKCALSWLTGDETIKS